MSNSKVPTGSGKNKIKVAHLTGKERSNLRALGHALSPVVQMGKGGLSQGVIEELQSALQAHELIKVRLLGECPLERGEAGSSIAAATGAHLVQALGGMLLLFKPHPKKPKISPTQAKPTEKAAGGKAKASASRKRLPPSRTGATYGRPRAGAETSATHRSSRAGTETSATRRAPRSRADTSTTYGRPHSRAETGATRRSPRAGAETSAPQRGPRTRAATSAPQRGPRSRAAKK